MNPAYLLYRHLSTIIFWLLLPFCILYTMLTKTYKNRFEQRIGFYPKRLRRKNQKRPRVWMHAASVGEVSVAAVIAEEILYLIPKAQIIVSTTTRTGQEFAKIKCPSSVDLILAPLDAVFVVRKSLLTIRPDLLVCVETEIWPNWFTEASRLGIETIVVNGRISVRSVKRYLKVSSLMQSILGKVTAFSMIHADDANRIAMMGAPQNRIFVNGNAKYDGLIRSQTAFRTEDFLKLYSLSGTEMVFVAGSTRQNEEEAVLQAYGEILKAFPETLLFIAPRHIERAHGVLKLSLERGHNCQLRSQFNGIDAQRTSPVVIIDTIGELAGVYGIGTISFCGGSLVPLGGQNLLEAAIWGTPVFYGPSMEDFKEAKSIIETIAGDDFLVHNGNELAHKALHYLSHPEERKMIGQKIRSEVMKHQGAAKKHAELIFEVLS